MNADDIVLDYTWADSVKDRDAHTDWSGEDILDVRYHAFGGKLAFRVHGVDFAPEGMVAILDFALSLAHVMEKLMAESDGGQCSLDFSEGEDELLFSTDGKHIIITSRRSARQARTNTGDFRTAAKSFTKRVLADAGQAVPSLRNHPAYHAWLEEAGP